MGAGRVGASGHKSRAMWIEGELKRSRGRRMKWLSRTERTDRLRPEGKAFHERVTRNSFSPSSYQRVQPAEVQSHLYVAVDQGYISQEVFDLVYQQAEKVSKLDSGFIKYLTSQLK